MLTHSSHCMCPTIEAQISNVLRVWLMIWFDIRLERANKHGKRVAEHENGQQKIVALFFFSPTTLHLLLGLPFDGKICKSVYCRSEKNQEKGVRHIFPSTSIGTVGAQKCEVFFFFVPTKVNQPWKALLGI